MTQFNSSITIKSVKIKNRVGMSPMCQYSSNDGFANDWHFIHYGTRAVGGVGLIVVEATAVAPEGRITPYDLGIWKDEHIEPLKKIVDQIEKFDCVPAIQIAHAGRKASHDKPSNGGAQLSTENGGWQTIGPSPIPFDKNEIVPTQLNKEDINNITLQFKDAALRALRAGFKILEIHSAHGYLLQEFLSPLSNIRKDEYGGSFENRIRFLLEVIDEVKTVWPTELPLFVRLSSTDWAEGGWDIDDTVRLSSVLKSKGVDLVDCSSGGNILGAKIPLEPGYQVKFAKAVKQTGILSSAVGLITNIEQINEILGNDKADIVLLGRELLRNPYFVNNHIADKKEWPEQYHRA